MPRPEARIGPTRPIILAASVMPFASIHAASSSNNNSPIRVIPISLRPVLKNSATFAGVNDFLILSINVLKILSPFVVLKLADIPFNKAEGVNDFSSSLEIFSGIPLNALVKLAPNSLKISVRGFSSVKPFSRFSINSSESSMPASVTGIPAVLSSLAKSTSAFSGALPLIDA